MTARETWERYALAWKTESAESKLATLKECTEPNCEYRDPQNQVSGQEALVQYMLQFHQQVPGGHFQTQEFSEHHGRSLARWIMLDGQGNPAGEGTSFGEYAESGKLIKMTGFF